MREIDCSKKVGYDLSDAFLEYNRSKGIQCIKGDLFEMPFDQEFDLVTCLHALFAFQEYKKILEGCVKALRPGGILIADIKNKVHAEATLKQKENDLWR